MKLNTTHHKLNILIIGLVLLIFSIGCAHVGDPCDNKILKRIPSPDGKFVLATYHRECSSQIYTAADLEKPAGFLQSKGDVVCHIMGWWDRHPVEAEWKDENNVFISTTDRLEKFDFQTSKDSCRSVRISYGVQFRKEQQKTDRPEVIAKIRKALSDIEPCITSHYKAANPHNEPAEDVNKMINNGEHRSAVQDILGSASRAGCPISPSTYDNLKELSEEFDLKPYYLERVTPLIKN